jgi:hypothetical protein
MSAGSSGGLTDDWLDGWVGREHSPGGSGVVHVVVTGLAGGDGSWTLEVVGGVVAAVAAGVPDTPDVTLTLPAALAHEVASGALSASAAYMQGRMKTAGDLGLTLDVLAAVDSR